MPTASMRMLSISIPRSSKAGAGDDVSWSSTSPSESPLPGTASAPAGPQSPWSFSRELSYRASSASSSWAARRRQSAQETSRRRTAATPTVAAATSTPALVPLPSPATSKARHKKFHRHFDSVAPDERVLNYYSCALISDILLQGHLYITSNYFAFYSNVFGYVTKLLIPTASVLKVSKEKTARIIPNAVGIATSEEKHVFGSLLSRDNTYKLMVQVWKTAVGPSDHPPSPLPLPHALPSPKDVKDDVDSASASGDILQDDDDSSLSGDGGPPTVATVPLDKVPMVAASCNPNTRGATATAGTVITAPASVSLAHVPAPVIGLGGLGPAAAAAAVAEADRRRSTRQTVILAVSTALVAFLLMSTAILFHRMARIQDQFRIQTGDGSYQDLARWQSSLHGRSASQVEEFLNTHLDQLAVVRRSLEALSMLIAINDGDRIQHDISMHHHSLYRDQKHETRSSSAGQEATDS